MIPKSFTYANPKSVDETTELLSEYSDDAKVLAGGMSLIPIMKLRLASPSVIIDINEVSELDYIRECDGKLAIGALTRHYALETSPLIRKNAFLLSETASWIADPQVRNMGTIGGALSHADPSGDWGSAMLALRAEMVVRNHKKERIIKADDFFVDTLASALAADELLTEIRVPVPTPKSGGAYSKLERKAGDFATVGVAAQISFDASGTCYYAGIGMTALGPTNLRAKNAEAELLGHKINDEIINRASDAASNDAQPEDDMLRGSAEYKRAMARIFTKHALRQSRARINSGE